jgi:hypothetical protein
MQRRDFTISAPRNRFSGLAAWFPWLAAPLFCLLPIGGCAVATSMRHGTAHIARTVIADPPLVAIGMSR